MRRPTSSIGLEPICAHGSSDIFDLVILIPVGIKLAVDLPESNQVGYVGDALFSFSFGQARKTDAVSGVHSPLELWLIHAVGPKEMQHHGFADAEAGVTRLQIQTAAADAFLTLIAAQQTVSAANAGVERARVLNEVVGSLVRSELRPGAEASRTRAELAVAENQLIQAEQAVNVGRAALAQLLGADPAAIQLSTGPLLGATPESEAPSHAAAQHPLAIAQNAAIEESRARLRVLGRSYFPRFNLQGLTYARGTGVQPDGTTGGAASGLGPNIQNWGLGMTVTFPAFDLASIRARKQMEMHRERAEAARYEQVIQDLAGQSAKAAATLEGARRIARNTPVQLDAARAQNSRPLRGTRLA